MNIKKEKHYNNHPSGVEAREVIGHLPFQLANIYKYVIRRHEKGKYDEDLDKAIQYIEWEIELPCIKFISEYCMNIARLNTVIFNEEIQEVNFFLKAYENYLFTKNDIFLNIMKNAILTLKESGK